MKLSIYGMGYVGLVTGVCLAELGHDVCCIDIDLEKINALKQGNLPIYEENLDALLRKNLKNHHVQFTADFQKAIDHGIVQIIAVGTPAKNDGAADLQFIDTVSTQIATRMSDYRCIVNKSTVPVGTAQRVQNIIRNTLNKACANFDFDVVANPEFLREGQAVTDCLAPDRIIIGAQTEKAKALMQDLYRPLTQKGYPLLCMDTASAELTKYAANAFLATKVSFMNEMSQIAERTGANIHAIKRALAMDSRINEKFLNAGCGFGGSCFPKDVAALKHIANQHNYEPHILNAVLKTNTQQQQVLFHKIKKYFKNNLKNKTIALWGLSFKPNTDDVRCASSRVLMGMLWEAGANVQAYDPLAMHNVRRDYGQTKQLVLCDTANDALQDADALAVVTEWDAFKNPDFDAMKKKLKIPVIFDGRNIYCALEVRNAGLDYFGIGC